MRTVVEMLQKAMKAYGVQDAFRYIETGKIKVKTYLEYIDDVKKFVTYIQKIAKDDINVAILAKNSYHYFVALLGAMAAGKTVIPLNIEETEDRIQYQIELTETHIILTDGSFEARETKFEKVNQNRLMNICGYLTSTVYEDSFNQIDEDALTMILFTSGTTGTSKGVMITQRNLFQPLKEYLPLQMNTELFPYLVLPMYHMAGITAFLSWISIGSCITISSGVRHIDNDLEQMRCNYTFVVPSILNMWHKYILKKKQSKLGDIRTICCGAAPLDSGWIQDFADCGIVINQMYAMTETSAKGTMNLLHTLDKPDSVGTFDTGLEYKVVNNELWLRGEAVTQGYYKSPEETAKAFNDGWFKTGDLVRIDKDGYLYITGRSKNIMILSGGENVSPEELECFFQQNPDILEIRISQRGDRICAEIYANADKWDSIRDYISQRNKELALYKRVTIVEFTSEAFGKTLTGKLRRADQYRE